MTRLQAAAETAHHAGSRNLSHFAAKEMRFAKLRKWGESMPMPAASRSTIASPPPSPTAPEMKRIAMLRERFIGGEDIELELVPKMVRESWIRSRNAGVDPLLARAPCDLERARADADTWLPGANKVIAFLANFFVEPHQLITVVDAQCRVLAIRGGCKALARAERIAAVPGADWSEAATGCNALATSMVIGGPAQVSWHENYISAVVDWTGIAVPIRRPGSDIVYGAVGISGYDTLTHPKVTELCIEASEMIASAIHAREATVHLAILEQYSRLLSHYPADGLIALDGAGRVLQATPAAMRLVVSGHAELLGRHLHETPFASHLGIDKDIPINLESLTSAVPPGVQLIPVEALPQNDGMIIVLARQRDKLARRKVAAKDWPARFSFSDLLGDSRVFRDCLERAKVASQCDLPILIEGESGTGKELIAQSVHNASARRDGPFVPLDCAALADDLIDMELFGYEEGTFTGAIKGGKAGKLLLAHGGTMFLDDVDNLPPKAQMRLLRVLESGQVVRIGGSSVQSVDVRVIAACNRELKELVDEGRFRHDLYYRLNVISVRLPALRERSEDVPTLARHVLQENHPNLDITDEVSSILERYRWPGNVRELRNVMLEAATFSRHDCIDVDALRQRLGSETGDEAVASNSRQYLLDRADAALIARTIAACDNVSDAAEQLGLHHATLYRRMKKYGISLPRKRRRNS